MLAPRLWHSISEKHGQKRTGVRTGSENLKRRSGRQGALHKSRRVRSRVAPLSAWALNPCITPKDYLGEFFRRITRKLGRPQAITATAHKLARIVFHLLSTKEAYNESVFHKTEEETIRRAQYRLCRQAAQLGFQIIPVEPNLAPTGCGRRFHQIHAALSRVPKSSDRPTRPTRNQEFGGRLREDRMPTAESGFDECLGCA
jgi:hypothetical protein